MWTLLVAACDWWRLWVMVSVQGYSNEEVASELLARGLPWCDGVVFLDAQDRKQVWGPGKQGRGGAGE